jgi:hypothetical protein
LSAGEVGRWLRVLVLVLVLPPMVLLPLLPLLPLTAAGHCYGGCRCCRATADAGAAVSL